MFRNGGGGFGCLAVLLAAAMLHCAAAGLIKVGGKACWKNNVNYTEWASHRHFYVGDWLYFVFDKRLYNVLEVNKTNYEQCRDTEFIHNVTRGGRDVFNLTEARPYYFLSSGGYCFHGMKVSVNVEQSRPPPPLSSPSLSSTGGAAPETKGDRIVVFSLLFVMSSFSALVFGII